MCGVAGVTVRLASCRPPSESSDFMVRRPFAVKSPGSTLEVPDSDGRVLLEARRCTQKKPAIRRMLTIRKNHLFMDCEGFETHPKAGCNKASVAEFDDQIRHYARH